MRDLEEVGRLVHILSVDTHDSCHEPKGQPTQPTWDRMCWFVMVKVKDDDTDYYGEGSHDHNHCQINTYDRRSNDHNE